MTNDELILKNILLDNVADIANLQAKALAEVLMMRVYYKQASLTFLLKQKSIRTDFADDEEKRNQALQTLLNEDAISVDERRLSAQAFEQIVAAVIADAENFKNTLNYSAKDFLTVLAEQLVELNK